MSRYIAMNQPVSHVLKPKPAVLGFKSGVKHTITGSSKHSGISIYSIKTCNRFSLGLISISKTKFFRYQSMHRTLSRVPLCLFVNSCKASVSGKFRKNGAAWREFSRFFASLDGSRNFRFGEPSVARSLQVKIVDALRFGERERASNLLLHLGRGFEPLRADDFFFILDYCARSPDPLFVMETWRVMEEQKVNVNQKCCVSIIRALSKGGYLDEALSWLTFLGESCQIRPTLSIYNAFLNGCAEERSAVHVDHCLQLMEGQHMGKSEVTYLELLKFAVWQQDLSAVNEIWKEYTKYYSPCIISLRKFIWSFTRLSDLESAYRVLQHMVTLVFHGSPSVTRSAEGRFRSSRLDIPIPSNNKFYLGDILAKSTEEMVLADDSLNISDMKNWSISGKENLDSDGVSVNLSQIPNASEFIFSSTLGNSLAIEGSKGYENLEFFDPKELKVRVTKSVMKVLRWSFSDVIYACAQLRNPRLAEHLFLQMHNLGLEPSLHTYNGFLKAVVSERDVTHGIEVVKAMKRRNLKPDNAILVTLAVGYSKMLELDLAEAVLDEITEGSPKYIHAFNSLLAAYDMMDEPERAVQVLARMKHLKLMPNIRTYELMFSLFVNVNAPYERGNRWSKVYSSNRIQAIEMDMMKNGMEHSHISMENLLKALGAEGMLRKMFQYIKVAKDHFFDGDTYPGTVMYDILLHALVEAKKSERAISVFRKMKFSNVPPDAATYNIMIDCCTITRSFKSACALVAAMLRDGFYPQTCTYSALIKILSANGYFDEALDLLSRASYGGVEPDVILFNTILLQAYLKQTKIAGLWKQGRIDILELIVDRMRVAKIKPDPSTCRYVFSAYVHRDLISTAMEALQVLSLRMISEDDCVLEEKKVEFQDLIVTEDPEAEARIIENFMDSGEHLVAAVLNLRWCEIAGFSVSWLPNDSPWAKRLTYCYSTSMGAT